MQTYRKCPIPPPSLTLFSFPKGKARWEKVDWKGDMANILFNKILFVLKIAIYFVYCLLFIAEINLNRIYIFQKLLCF